MNILKDKKIFVTGHNGLVGSALVRALQRNGYRHILCQARTELDLRDRNQVFHYFEKERPQWVFMSAAVVGGIHANKTYPVEFLLDNLKIQNNVIEAAHHFSVQKLMFLASTCAYPKFSPQPMKEEYLMSSALEPTNEPYAVAKIAGIKLCKAYKDQYGDNFLSVMPTNIYGPNDNYHEKNAHVIPCLIRRFHDAKLKGETQIPVWGSGMALREFLYSDDLAEACLFIMEKIDKNEVGEILNIGTQSEISIKELAEKIKDVVGMKAELVFDISRPEGSPRKLTDSSKIHNLGWRPRINLDEGLRISYHDFLNNPKTRL